MLELIIYLIVMVLGSIGVYKFSTNLEKLDIINFIFNNYK